MNLNYMDKAILNLKAKNYELAKEYICKAMMMMTQLQITIYLEHYMN